MSEEKRLHAQLFLKIHDYLHPSMPEYDRFKSTLKLFLPAGDIARSKNVLDMLDKLETRGKIGIGNYDNLNMCLKDADLVDLIPEVEKYETDIWKALHPEQGRRETGTMEFSSACRLPTERIALSSMGRESSRQPHHETVAKQPVSAFDVSDGRTGDKTVAKQPQSALFGSLPYELHQIPDVPGRSIRYEQRQNPTYAGWTGDETVAKQPESTLFSGEPYELRVIPDVPCRSAGYKERQNPTYAETTRDNIYKSSKIFKIVQLSDACKDWRSLGRELGLDEAVFDVISHDYNQQLREQCYQMLRTWLQQSGKLATPKALITALRNLHHNKAAEKIIEYFTDHPLEL